MFSDDEKEREEEAAPPRDAEFRKMLEEYAADLRAILDKLRGKLN